MHEVSLMQSALALAEEAAREQGATRIHVFRMRIGALSGVVPEALEFAFEVVCAGTLAEGARLEIETVPVRCWCPQCRAEFASDDLLGECPRCHTISAELRTGREIELGSLEVS